MGRTLRLLRATALFFAVAIISYAASVAPDFYFEIMDYQMMWDMWGIFFVGFSILWLIFTPFTREGGDYVYRSMAVFMPVLIIGMLVLAQYHFFIAAALVGIVMLLTACCLYAVATGVLKGGPRAAGRFFVVLSFLILFIPSMAAVLRYDVGLPTWHSRRGIVDELAEKAAASRPEERPDPPVLACFEPERWRGYSPEERISLLQALADYEAEVRLGISKVEVKAVAREGGYAGEFSAEDDEITMNYAYIEEEPVFEVVRTLLHEVYHHYQLYIMTNVDWDSPLAKTAYFAEARSWLENRDNYIQVYEDQEAYENQPLEASARAFAERELARLLPAATERVY